MIDNDTTPLSSSGDQLYGYYYDEQLVQVFKYGVTCLKWAKENDSQSPLIRTLK